MPISECLENSFNIMCFYLSDYQRRKCLNVMVHQMVFVHTMPRELNDVDYTYAELDLCVIV